MNLRKEKNQAYEMKFSVKMDSADVGNMESAVDILIKFGNAKQILEFLCNVENVNTEKLEKHLINLINQRDIYYRELRNITKYAINSQCANPKNIQEMLVSFIKNDLVKTDNVKYAREICREVKGIDLDYIEQVIEEKKQIFRPSNNVLKKINLEIQKIRKKECQEQNK